MDDRSAASFNGQISEEAAAWFVEFRTEELDVEQRMAFDAWLRMSPEHVRAFLEIATVWNESQALDPMRNIDVGQLADRYGAGNNIIALPDTGNDPNPARTAIARAPLHWQRRIARPALAAAACTALIAVALLLWAPWRVPYIYRTATGERRALTLADGSSVTLDGRSAMRVRFTSSGRLVELLEGQALFQIAPDSARPFAVVSGATLLRDIGTQFDVSRNFNGTTVTVVSGRVAVYAAGATAGDSRTPGTQLVAANDEPVLLDAGEQLRVVDGSPRARPIAVDAGSATAWRKGQIVLNGSTLDDVVEEFNRYSPRQLIAEDRGAEPLRLSGVFGIDPEFLIGYLRARPDIIVSEHADRITIIRTSGR